MLVAVGLVAEGGCASAVKLLPLLPETRKFTGAVRGIAGGVEVEAVSPERSAGGVRKEYEAVSNGRSVASAPTPERGFTRTLGMASISSVCGPKT